jgi:small subunit ribosomal protein S4e
MHQTRKASTTKLPIPRKGTKYIVRAAGYVDSSVPVLIAVRDMLKLAKTSKEVKNLVHNRLLKLNGKAVKDYHESIKLFNLFEAGKTYALSILPSGKFTFVETKNKNSRLCKITGKRMIGKNLFQFNLHDGSNITDKNTFTIGDSVYLSLDGKVVKTIPLKEGSDVFIMSGRHIGKEGKAGSMSGNRILVNFKENSAQIEKSRVVAL